MLLDNNNIIYLETLVETRVTQPIQKTEKNEDLIVEAFSHFNIKKKSSRTVIPQLHQKYDLHVASTEESDKLNMNIPNRRDAYGNIIKKKHKTHRLKFKDVGFIEEIKVENWKKYNVLEEKDDGKVTCDCNCNVF